MDIAEVRRSQGYHVAVGVGLVSYGLLHVILAWLAVQVATGKKGDASQQGALGQVAQQPLGVALLWLMAIGLLTLTIWQALEATIGRDEPGRDGRPRRRIASAGRAVVYLALGVLAIGVASGSGGKSGQGEETLSARLMSVPFGRVLVGGRCRGHRRGGGAGGQGRQAELHRGSPVRSRPGRPPARHHRLLRQRGEPRGHRDALRVGSAHLRPGGGGWHGCGVDHRA